MKNKTFFLLFILLTASVVYAQSGSKDFSGTLLWKISGNKLVSPSYIVGTHHLMHANFIDSIPQLMETFNNADQIVGELVIDDKALLQKEIQLAAMMPADTTYKDLLKEKDYIDLDNALKASFGAGIDRFGILRPAMIDLMFSVGMYAKQHADFDAVAHESIDERMQILGKENNKSILRLESVNDQIYALFGSRSLKAQAESLVCGINSPEWSEKSLEQLNEYYKRGDLNGMYHLAFDNPADPCPVSENEREVLLKDRNKKWMTELPAIFADKSTLVVVGALHLAGEDGLLEQLAKLGYEITPMK